MSKRRHSDIDEEEGTINDSLPNRNGLDQEAPSSLNWSIIISALSRLVLSRVARNQKIRKEHFQPILQKFNYKSPFADLVTQLNLELSSTLGLSVTLNGNELLVTSALEGSSKQILYELWEDTTDAISSELDYSSPLMMMPLSTRTCSTVSTSEEFQGGLLLLIISLITLSGNRLGEIDLLQHLGQFGLSRSLTTVVPVMNKPVQTILDELTKKDYLRRSASDRKGSSNRVADYSVGERSMREVGPSEIYEFISNMFVSDEKRGEVLRSVQKIHPGFVLQEDSRLHH